MTAVSDPEAPDQDGWGAEVWEFLVPPDLAAWWPEAAALEEAAK